MLQIDRRQLLGGLICGSAALASITPAYAKSQLGWTPQALTRAQAMALDAYAEALIPVTDTPGAREAGVPQFVDRAVATYCDQLEAAAIRTALNKIDADAKQVYGQAFTNLPPAHQEALMARWDAEAINDTTAPATPLAVLKSYATVGFFTSEPGAQRTLRYDPVPGAYRGCVPLREIGRAWAT